MIEVRAQLRHLRMSHKKVRVVAHALKGMDVKSALVRVGFVNRAASAPIAKLLKSAIANAEHNNNLKADDLIVKNIVVNQAPVLKRWKPAAFGSAHGYKKHACHVVLTLGLKQGAVHHSAKEKAAKEVSEKQKTSKKVASQKKEAAVKPRKSTVSRTQTKKRSAQSTNKAA